LIFDSRLAWWGRLLADRGDRLEDALSLTVLMFGGLFLRGPFRPRLAASSVLPAFALSVRGDLAARVRFGARLAQCLLASCARGSLTRPAPAAATASSPARSLAGLRAAFLFGFGAFGLLCGALGETLLLFVLLRLGPLGAV
jgi:hypothetical protein